MKAEFPCEGCRCEPACPYLKDYAAAARLCPPAEVVIGNDRYQRELPGHDVIDEVMARSYALIVDEDSRARDEEHAERHDQIMQLEHDSFNAARKKLLAAGLFFQIPVDVIAVVLRLHPDSVRRNAKRVSPVKATISMD